MYVVLGVHHPKPGIEKALLQTLKRYGKAERGHTGLIAAFVWKDDNSGVIFGTTLWDTKADFDAARPVMDKALEGVDFGSLDESLQIYRGSPVVWT
jgi:Antibiotic biosynthesis monooxygenase